MEKINLTALVILILSLCIACQTNESNTDTVSIKEEINTGKLSLFKEGLISTELYERDLAITAAQDELIYTLGDYKQTTRCLVNSRKVNGKWSDPEILNISGEYQDIEPFYFADAKVLYFASNRPIFNDTSRNDFNIWFSSRQGNHWSEPIPLDSIINTKEDEYYPSLSSNGNLYFTSIRKEGFGQEDIFLAENIDGVLQAPKPLPAEINTSLFEFNAFVNPNEEFIIFSSYGREDGMGGGDLYISEKDKNGKWLKSRNLGKDINSSKLDYCPFVDSKMEVFYFTSERTFRKNTKLKNINRLKEIANSVDNGLGNIYQIDFGELGINKE